MEMYFPACLFRQNRYAIMACCHFFRPTSSSSKSPQTDARRSGRFPAFPLPSLSTFPFVFARFCQGRS